VQELKQSPKRILYEAFAQASRAKLYVDNAGLAVFTEKISKKSVKINMEEYDRVLMLGLTLSDITPVLMHIKNLAINRNTNVLELPWTASYADINIISHFCEFSEILIHYILKRLSLFSSKTEFLSEELNYFGAYLESRLNNPIFRENNDNAAIDNVWLQGYSECFDDWMMWQRGNLDEKPNIKLNVSRDIIGFLKEYSNSDLSNNRSILISLLEQTNHNLEAIVKTIDACFQKARKNRKFTGYIAQTEDLIISIVVSFDNDLDKLNNMVFSRTRVEMYKSKKQFGFGLGFNPNQTNYTTVWLDSEWEYNDHLENLIK